MPLMDFFEPLWKGLITGLMFTLTFGTVFFSLIQTSIKRGIKKAVFIAVGVVASDIFYIAIVLFGSTFFIDKITHYDHTIRIIGFCFLLFLGIRSIMKKEAFTEQDDLENEKRNVLYFLKGIMLNSINPMILVAWLGVATYVETVNKFNLLQSEFFFAMVIATMFITMLAIAYFARKLKDILSPENMHRLNVLSGIIFIVFAVVIVWPITGLHIF